MTGATPSVDHGALTWHEVQRVRPEEATVQATVGQATVQATVGQATVQATVGQATVQATVREATVQATVGHATVQATVEAAANGKPHEESEAFNTVGACGRWKRTKPPLLQWERHIIWQRTLARFRHDRWEASAAC